MRIVANKILTNSQLEASRIDEKELEGFIRMDLANAIAKELFKIEGITNTTTVLLMRVLKYTYGWLQPELLSRR